ncbi:putative RNA-binding protein (virulence factor B family) [Peribacillus deserti]|uniref:RNA-binding protein (Virulence factor B family) n=1 Tax=Peribacillus deserti TaxID=673318 RepID=A0ABS2QJP0_9BACI|nr:S1 RNA-binding domain-containing protein [Peribacillus deserti]MBM7693391.1 putative RNA-binding protein (virulence factor B family) [Peribacillus deserti]
MEFLEAGKVVKLRVDREARAERADEAFGFFLTNEEDESVLLHKTEINGEVEIGEDIEVFLYQDKTGRLAATMTIPDVQIGTYAWAEVVEVRHDLGAFVNIGISKDLLVSLDDLPLIENLWPEPGDRLYVSLKTDSRGRLFGKLATEDVMGSITNKALFTMENKDIKGTVYRLLKVGSFIITEEGYRGFIHESERKREPRLGQMVEGRVIEVKEDGSLNISLLPRKQEKMDEDAEVLWEYLMSRNGAMPFSDKSLPEDIQSKFGLSKASFKRALGKLMKEQKVYQENGWTYSSDRK